MKTSITAIESASKNTPLVLRGDFADSIIHAACLGYDGIELHISDPDTVDKQKIKTVLKKNHMVITSIGTGPSYSREGISMTHPSPEIRAEAVRRMKGHIRIGAEFGAIVIIGLIKGQKKNCRSNEKYMDYFNSSIEVCEKMAEKLGVTIVLEVIDRFESDWLNTVEEGLKLLDCIGSNRFKLHLDTFHMNIEEANCSESILKAAGRIGHIHIADSDRWYPGHAHYDFESTFSSLKQINYQGAVVLESFLYPDPDTAAKLALEKIRILC